MRLKPEQTRPNECEAVKRDARAQSDHKKGGMKGLFDDYSHGNNL